MGTNLKETTNVTLDTLIMDRNFKCRHKPILYRGGFKTIKDIMDAGEDGLQKFTNFGQQYIHEISITLSDYGFELPEHGDLDIGKRLNTHYSYDLDESIRHIFPDGRLRAYLSKYGNCKTIRDVVNLGYDGLSKIDGIGPKYLEKITSILSTYGIELN